MDAASPTPGNYPTSGRGRRINWSKIGNLYTSALIPPTIYNLHFKFVLHRRFVPTWKLETHRHAGCRLGCGHKRESVEHWGSCPTLDGIRSKLTALTQEPRFKNPLTFLLGETPVGLLDRGAANFWLILWHSLMLHLIKITADGAVPDLSNVWKLSIRQFADLTLALAYKAERSLQRKLAKGLEPGAEFPVQNKLLAPLASLDAEAGVIWSPSFRTELTNLDLPGYIASSHDGPPRRVKLEPIKFVKGPLHPK